jgi:hypothetical protein
LIFANSHNLFPKKHSVMLKSYGWRAGADSFLVWTGQVFRAGLSLNEEEISMSAIVRLGDFVEATFVGQAGEKRRGIITNFYSDKMVLVELGDVLVLCTDPRKIPEQELSRGQKDWVIRRRATLGDGNRAWSC